MPEAVSHRKVCFPDKPKTGHVDEEAEADEDNGEDPKQEKDDTVQ